MRRARPSPGDASLPPHLHIDNGPLSGALIKTRAPPALPRPRPAPPRPPTAHAYALALAGLRPQKLRTPLRWPTTALE